LKLVRPAGFEPTTLGFGGRYSIQLSYRRNVGVAILLAVGERRPAPRGLWHSLRGGLQFEDGRPIAGRGAGAGLAGKSQV
jgi:hypothetical protein